MSRTELADGEPPTEDDESPVRLPGSPEEDAACLTPADAYAAAFQMLCKYADMSTAIRNGVFIQGIVILSGIMFLVSEEKYFFSILGCAFLLGFTIILSYMHDHYNKYFFSVREYIRNLEANHSVRGMRGYVEFVESERDIRVDGNYVGWLRMHGPFILIISAALFLLVNIVFADDEICLYFIEECSVLNGDMSDQGDVEHTSSSDSASPSRAEDGS